MAIQTTVFATRRTAAMGKSEPKRMKRRSIDPRSGHALVILGHAIEYLTDEFIHEGGFFDANRGQIDAIQLLMALNRQIYMACPEAPTFTQWLGSLFHKKEDSRFSHSRI